MVAPTRSDKRRDERSYVRIGAYVRQKGHGRSPVEIADISRSGFRMYCLSPLDTGSSFLMQLPGFSPLRARIAWQDGECFGCTFEGKLHVAIFEHIAGQHPGLTNAA